MARIVAHLVGVQEHIASAGCQHHCGLICAVSAHGDTCQPLELQPVVVADTCSVQELESQLPYPVLWNNTPRGCLGESAAPWRPLGSQDAARACVYARGCAMQPCAAGVLIGRAWTLAHVQQEPSNTLERLGSTVRGVCNTGQAQQFPT